jgi:kynurenine 3-monooxygenase
MSAISQEPVIVLGNGLSGSLMAVYLAKRGFNVHVYERRPDMRRTDISAGKSINLAISVRGLHALREVGIEDRILEVCIPMRGRMMHDRQGNLTYQSYSKDGVTAINSVSRGDLNKELMTLAESHPNVKFHFNQRCTGMNLETGEVTLRDEDTGREYTAKGQTIIAADGAFSGARPALYRTSRFDYSQVFLPHGYKELEIPPAPGGGWRMEKNALHIWPRGEFMLIALPNMDGSYTVTLFFPFEGERSFSSLNSPEKVEAFFREMYPDALELMPNLREDFFSNPTGELVTVKCRPWSYKGTLALVGDAAHAVVPFYGQGMNAAFEDCTVMNECLEGFDGNWEKVFQRYQNARIANGHAIADMANENYYEMRDKVGDPVWLFRKKVEHLLEARFPGKYVSRYEMISFTRTPYAEAMRRGAINESILDSLCVGLENPEAVDMVLAEKLIEELL